MQLKAWSDKAKGRIQSAVACVTVGGAAVVAALSEWGINVCGG